MVLKDMGLEDNAAVDGKLAFPDHPEVSVITDAELRNMFNEGVYKTGRKRNPTSSFVCKIPSDSTYRKYKKQILDSMLKKREQEERSAEDNADGHQ